VSLLPQRPDGSSAIDVHIAVEPLDDTEVVSWLRAHESLVTLTVTRLADRLGGTADTKTQFSTDYASRYVRFVDTTAQELRLRASTSVVTRTPSPSTLAATSTQRCGIALRADSAVTSGE